MKATSISLGEPLAVNVLESIYRVDRPELDWVEGVRHVVEPSAHGAVIVQAYLYDASDPQRLRARSICGGTDEQKAWLESAGRRAQGQEQLVRQAFEGQASARVTSEVQSEQDRKQLLGKVFANDWGIIDCWGLMGGDLHGRGFAIGVMLTHDAVPLEPGLAAHWQSVAAHLSAAFCLREAMAAGLAPTESVLAPDGKLLHAEGEARSSEARESLRHAVRAIDRARVRHRQQAGEALAAWQAVVAGRWTLVDQTESDGKRTLVARVNDLPVRAEARLSEREAQALGLAVEGLSNKQISYRLGVGAPAVTNYLRRAAQKLGVRNRSDLVRRPGPEPRAGRRVGGASDGASGVSPGASGATSLRGSWASDRGRDAARGRGRTSASAGPWSALRTRRRGADVVVSCSPGLLATLARVLRKWLDAMKKLAGLVPGEPQGVSLLEAAYRIDRHELDWVEGVRQAVLPSAQGAALVQAFLYDASDAHNLQLRMVRGGTEEQQQWMEATGPLSNGLGAFVERAFEGQAGSRVSSEVQTHEGNSRLIERVFANDWGIVDGWGVLGADLRRRGLMVGALSTCLVAPLAPGLAALWQSVAAHLSAAFCLREAMAAGLAPTESVLAPDGKLLHAEGEARSSEARESLRHAVRAIDRARVRHRQQAGDALAAWQAVVSGRWTLVDQTESDGKRTLVARVQRSARACGGEAVGARGAGARAGGAGAEQQADQLPPRRRRTGRDQLPQASLGQARRHQPLGPHATSPARLLDGVSSRWRRDLPHPLPAPQGGGSEDS